MIEWQQKFVRQAAAAGYDAMACDNYQPTGYGAGCGIYSNGKWVQKYTGKPGDMQLEYDVIDWMAQFVKLAHTVQSKSGRPMMVRYVGARQCLTALNLLLFERILWMPLRCITVAAVMYRSFRTCVASQPTIALGRIPTEY